LYGSETEGIMQTKLTLRLDGALVKKAKAHARRSGRSLSRLVADYFSLLGSKPRRRPALTPTVKALKGALKGSTVSEKDYKRYLAEKYR
jgi:hypothetical protein